MSAYVADNPLKALKDELEATLRRVQLALEAYLEDPAELTRLVSVAEYVDQIRGVFIMLEQPEAASLTTEMVAVARDLVDDERQRTESERDTLLDVLLHGVLQLPRYLDWLQRGGSSETFRLLPLIEQMRVARGLAPSAEPEESASVVNGRRKDAWQNLRKLATQLRPPLQRNLAGVLRGQALADNLTRIAEIFVKFKETACNESYYHLWWLAEGLLLQVSSGAIALGQQINILLRDLDLQVKRMIDGQEALLEDTAIQEISQRIIDHLSNSHSGLARLKNRVDYHPPQAESTLTVPGIAMVLPDTETLLQIAAILKESLARLMDAVDRFAREGEHQVDGLGVELARLHEVVNVLTMLNMDVPADLVRRHMTVLQQWIEGAGDVSEEQIFQLASELILVENSLEGVVELVYSQGMSAVVAADLDDAGRVRRLMEFEHRRARMIVIHEAVNAMASAREIAITHIDSQDKLIAWSDLQTMLHNIGSILAILECERAVTLMNRLTEIIQALASEVVVKDKTLFISAFAQVMVALEYYLELLVHVKKPDDDILDHATDQLATLEQLIDVSLLQLGAEAEALPSSETETTTLLELDTQEIPEAKAASIEQVEFEAIQTPEERDEAMELLEITSERALQAEAAESDELVEFEAAEASSPEPDSIKVFEVASEEASGPEAEAEAIELVELEAPQISQAEGEALEFFEIGPERAPQTEAEPGKQEEVEAAETAIPEASTSDASGVDSEFVEVFFEEAQEELANMREQLAIWHENLADREALQFIRRIFHTLKGSGRMVGEFTIGEFAWSFENLLNRVLDGTVAASPAILEAVDAAQAALRPIVGDVPKQGGEEAVLAELASRNEALLCGEASPAELQPSPASAETAEIVPEAAPAVFEEQTVLVPETSTAVTTPRPEAGEERLPEPSAPAPAMALAPADQELIEVFQYEAAEILDASDGILERWGEDQDNVELLNDLRRAMHTLKGSSRMAGLMDIGDLAHAMESLLGAVSKGEIKASTAVMDTLQRALDELNGMLAQIQSGAELAPALDLVNDIDNLITIAAAVEAPSATAEEKIPAQQTVAAEVVPVSELAAPVEQLTELDQELVEVFQYEAAEILDASDGILQRWNVERENTELLNDLRREMHTLKGSSRMAGFMGIGDLAHAMESLLDAISKGSLEASTVVVNALQSALDDLNGLVAAVRSGADLFPAEDRINELKRLLSGELVQPAVSTPAPQPRQPTRPAEAVEPAAQAAAAAQLGAETIRVSAPLLNNLVNQMGESSIYRARVDEGVGSLRFNLGELSQTVSRLRQQLRRLEIETEAQIRFRYEEAPKDYVEDFDPLELDRFSELQQVSRSLMEIVDDLSNVQNTLEDQSQDMSFLLDQQAKINKEIQQGLMQTRMVSFGSAVPRLRRVVRQSCQELGKRAELVLQGSEAEVDRSVLENMVAPLEHMMRNAISHGIELPEQRRAAGKSEMGTVTLALSREGAELVLQLIDDGAGLNFDTIRAKGEANALLSAGQAVTEQDLIALLLRPGFSTATKVTQISGRGVGMDVLNDAIKSMRGALQIQSKRGQGTQFTIRLPFSLAVTQALLIKAGSDTYAVPLLSIEAVTRLNEGEFQAYLGGKSVQHEYREHRYPVHSLRVVFDNEELVPYEDINDQRPPVLLFRSAEASAALQVDAMLGNQEILVKPVGPQFNAVPGISGATVLGDGRVIVVLELAALVRSLSSQARQKDELRRLHIARQEVRPERLTAIVIDDSITMRKVTARFLERHNMNVMIAKDGVEAVAQLEEQAPDLVIMDIEMPRMDGFEVLAHIRNRPHLKDLPVIMVTSRSGEKHRERATKLGVNDYLIKPYQEDEMMQSIRRVLSERELELLV